MCNQANDTLQAILTELNMWHTQDSIFLEKHTLFHMTAFKVKICDTYKISGMLNAVLKISRKIFILDKRVLLFDGPICLRHNNVVYRWKAYEKTNILTYNKLEFFLTYSVSWNWQKYHHGREPGHLIEKKYQVSGHYLCICWGVLNYIYYECAIVELEVTAGYRKTPLLNCDNAFGGYGVSFLTVTSYCVVQFS